MTNEQENQIRAHREDIWYDIRRAIDSQWNKYGGPEHDDEHARRDWVSLICGQLGKADRHADDLATAGFISAMIQVAAVAVSAIESTERIADNK